MSLCWEQPPHYIVGRDLFLNLPSTLGHCSFQLNVIRLLTGQGTTRTLTIGVIYKTCYNLCQLSEFSNILAHLELK